jgi:hypothetical protein
MRTPAATIAGMLQATGNPRNCPGKSPGYGAGRSAVARLRGHSPGGALTAGDPPPHPFLA